MTRLKNLGHDGRYRLFDWNMRVVLPGEFATRTKAVLGALVACRPVLLFCGATAVGEWTPALGFKEVV